MKGKYIALFVCLAVCCFLPTIGFSIASYIIAAQNWNSACDSGSLVPLYIWLVVNASVGLGSLLLVGLLVPFIFFGSDVFKFGSVITIAVLLVLNWFFMIAWNVVGSVSLFRDSMDCKYTAYSIFVMMIIALAFQWCAILGGLCGSKKYRKLVELGDSA